MKMIKTDFDLKVNVSSSWTVYITKTCQEANMIHQTCLTQKEILGGDWHYHVSTAEVQRDCRVPEFFHDRGYWATIVEHNNGDWDKAPTYTLYIVD